MTPSRPDRDGAAAAAAALQMPPLFQQRRWWILAMLFCVTMINFVDRQTLSVTAPKLREIFSLSNTQYGIIVASFQMGMVFGEFPMGWLMDRRGARFGLTFAVMWWSSLLQPRVGEPAVHVEGRGHGRRSAGQRVRPRQLRHALRAARRRVHPVQPVGGACRAHPVQRPGGQRRTRSSTRASPSSPTREDRIRHLAGKDVFLMFDVGEAADKLVAGYTFYQPVHSGPGRRTTTPTRKRSTSSSRATARWRCTSPPRS